MNGRILLVDDEQSIRDSLSKVLRAEGHDIVLAEDGEQAIEKLAQAPVDLLLLDLGLPVNDGWAALDWLAQVLRGLTPDAARRRPVGLAVRHGVFAGSRGGEDLVRNRLAPSGGQPVARRANAHAITGRTNPDRFVGGATEEAPVARVGEGIVTTIGASTTYKEVPESPERISTTVLGEALDANTAFEIPSTDIADVDVGENVDARLQAEQAQANRLIAPAQAEVRRRGHRTGNGGARLVALGRDARTVRSAFIASPVCGPPKAFGDSRP